MFKFNEHQNVEHAKNFDFAIFLCRVLDRKALYIVDSFNFTFSRTENRPWTRFHEMKIERQFDFTF